MLKPLNQVLSSLVDQEAGQQIESDVSFEGSYPVEEFEVRIMEPDRSGGAWQSRATIPMQSSENALTVRVVTLYVSLYWTFVCVRVCASLILHGVNICCNIRDVLCGQKSLYMFLCSITEFHNTRK